MNSVNHSNNITKQQCLFQSAGSEITKLKLENENLANELKAKDEKLFEQKVYINDTTNEVNLFSNHVAHIQKHLYLITS